MFAWCPHVRRHHPGGSGITCFPKSRGYVYAIFVVL
nr:MAG TPA: hypothetical protein [Inoviridae sp.]